MKTSTPMAKAAQANDPKCPKGHPLTIVDDGDFLFGKCETCPDIWRVMADGQIIPKGHPLS